MKYLFFANTDWYLYNFRLSLATALREQNHEVVLISPDGKYRHLLEENGFRWIDFPFSRKGMNFFEELWTIKRLVEIYRRENPDIVHHFTIKCNLYGSVAAKLTGVSNVVNAVTGLGAVFIDGAWWLKLLVSFLYRAILYQTWVIFQNADDQEEFVTRQFVEPTRAFLVRGSGVNMDQFEFAPESKETPIVILPARLLWSKGVGEFVEAARLLHNRAIRARFVLVGDTDAGNPAAIDQATIEKWEHNKIIEYWGWRENMVDVYHKAHIVCLPSYREGVPKTLLEAAACGRPLIATDVPGCREIVHHGVNGLLVPVKDSLALAQALEELIVAEVRRKEMGLKGRKIVAQEFSEERVITETLATYRKIRGVLN